MPSHQEILATLQLNALRDVGPARFQKLIDYFGSGLNAVESGPSEWSGIRLFDSEILDRIRNGWAAAKLCSLKDFEVAESRGVQFFLVHEGSYPTRLREIASPPPVLYVQGKNFDPEAAAVALVGSRRSSYYAERTARWLSEDLAQAGVTTVSGLARGIDMCVHEATVKAGGRTWAVLGSGFSYIYPPENKKLAEAIIESGALISEFPLMSRPHPSSFPRRNRIISGLSLGTVVVEGTDKSGSLITARLAADQGREVMAVPGPVRATGAVAPNLLIKAGATLIESAEDILEAVGLRSVIKDKKSAMKLDMSEPFESVMQHLDHEPISREVLAERLQKTTGEISTLILEMELQGLVRCLSSGSVVKT